METSQLNPFDKIVYQATRDIFVNEKANTRKLKTVKRYIRQYPGDRSSVLQLVAQHGGGVVHESVLRLLSNEVYGSNLVASQRFPDLFEPSAMQSEAAALSEEQATTAKQATHGVIAQTHSDDCQEISDSTEATMIPNVFESSIAENEVGNSSVLPVYLPFPAEHMLMEKLQRILELDCYQFGLKVMPNIMQKQGWDCPESVELTKWVKLFRRKGDIAIWQENGKPSKELLHSIATIRHTAVHRLRTDSVRLEGFLADAERFAEVLGIDTFTQAISHLRMDTHATLTELIQNKQSTQLQLEKAQEEIARQRNELDQKEREVLRAMVSQDRKHCDLAGERLEEFLHLMEDLRASSDGQGVVLDTVDAIGHEALSDDISDYDDEEQFEDCSEA